MPLKHIALIGAGAMGSFFAPRLYETFGDDFFLIADGERKNRLESEGITINGTNYRFPVKSPDKKIDCRLIIISVKSPALDEAIEQIKNFVAPDTIILSVLNGMESEERIISAYGEKHVIYSFMRVSIVMKNHICEYEPNKGYVAFGEKENNIYSDRVLMVKEIMELAGIPYVIPDDMIHDMWFKFMCNVGENMTCALLGIPFGAFRSSKHANAIRIGAMEEVVRIAQSVGVNIGKREIDEQNAFIKMLPFNNKPSTLQDLEAGKFITETDIFSGFVVKMGKKLGIDTPINSYLYHSIKTLEEKNRGDFYKPNEK